MINILRINDEELIEVSHDVWENTEGDIPCASVSYFKTDTAHVETKYFVRRDT